MTGELMILADEFYNPTGETSQVIGWLAWAASAAGVAGLIIIGMQMAMQFSRGEPGEGARHFRGFAIVAFACVLAAAAGPTVTMLGPFNLAP